MPNYSRNLKFIYEKPKKFSIVFAVYLAGIITILIFALLIKSYSKLNLKAIEYNNNLVVTSTLDNVQIIAKSKLYKINNKKNKVEILEYSEIYNNGDINLQDITIKSLNSIKENQIVDITFYYDKDLLIKKIMRGVLK